jgi:hypothetical protein
MPGAVAYSQRGYPRIIYHMIVSGRSDGLVKDILAAPCAMFWLF